MASLKEKVKNMKKVDMDDYNHDDYAYLTDLKNVMDRGYELIGAGRIHLADSLTIAKITVGNILDIMDSWKKFSEACLVLITGYDNNVELIQKVAMVRMVTENRMDVVLNKTSLDAFELNNAFRSFEAAAEATELWSLLSDEIHKEEGKMETKESK